MNLLNNSINKFTRTVGLFRVFYFVPLLLLLIVVAPNIFDELTLNIDRSIYDYTDLRMIVLEIIKLVIYFIIFYRLFKTYRKSLNFFKYIKIMWLRFFIIYLIIYLLSVFVEEYFISTTNSQIAMELVYGICISLWLILKNFTTFALFYYFSNKKFPISTYKVQINFDLIILSAVVTVITCIFYIYKIKMDNDFIKQLSSSLFIPKDDSLYRIVGFAKSIINFLFCSYLILYFFSDLKVPTSRSDSQEVYYMPKNDSTKGTP